MRRLLRVVLPVVILVFLPVSGAFPTRLPAAHAQQVPGTPDDPANPGARGDSGQNPARAFALVRQAEQQIGEEKFDEALASLAQARQASPGMARISFLMAVCEYNLGLKTTNPERSNRAKLLTEECFKLDPDWGEPYFFRGVMAFNASDFEMAVWGFQNALARGYLPKDSRVNLAHSLFKWGVVLAGENQPVSNLAIGIRVFTDAVDRFAALKDDLRFGAEDRQSFGQYWIDSLVNLVALYQRSEEFDNAERILNGLIQLEPENYLHHYNLGLVLGGTYKHWDRALEQYHLALELCDDPDWIEPYPMIGYILSNRAKTEAEETEAESWFERYLARYPNDAATLIRAGDHYRSTATRQPVEQLEKRERLLELAIRSYERCLESQPHMLPAMFKLSEVLHMAKRDAESARWKSLYDELKEIAGPGPLPKAGGGGK